MAEAKATAYERPRAMRVGGLSEGTGVSCFLGEAQACSQPGSGNEFCGPGASATMACEYTGTSAVSVCYYSGLSAAETCAGTGSGASIRPPVNRAS